MKPPQQWMSQLTALIPSLNLITDPHLAQLEVDLLAESRLSLNYIALVVASAGIATIGLIANSTAVIIGAMIVAPLMLPIRGSIFGILTANPALTQRGLKSIWVGSLLGIGIAFCLGLVIPFASFGSEILSRTKPNTLDLVVAILAGAIGTFAKCRPRIEDSLAGVAISVALMPPLCVVGLGLAKADWYTCGGAFLLYITNLVGIALACHVVFFVVGYAPQRSRFLLSRGAFGAFGFWLFLALLTLVPLSKSRLAFLQQDYFEVLVNTILAEEVETFQDVRLLESNFDWQATPPSAEVLLLSKTFFTPQHEALLRAQIEERTGETVDLNVSVIPVR